MANYLPDDFYSPSSQPTIQNTAVQNTPVNNQFLPPEFYNPNAGQAATPPPSTYIAGQFGPVGLYNDIVHNLQNLPQIASDAGKNAEDVIGGLVQGAANAPGNILNMGKNLEGIKTPETFPTPITGNPEDTLTKMANFAGGNVAPGGIAATGLEKAGILATNPLLRNAAVNAAVGFMNNAGDQGGRMLNALNNALFPTAVKTVTGLPDFINLASGYATKSASEDMVQNLEGGKILPPDALNTQNAQILKNNYINNVTTTRLGFGTLNKQLTARNYAQGNTLLPNGADNSQGILLDAEGNVIPSTMIQNIPKENALAASMYQSGNGLDNLKGSILDALPEFKQEYLDSAKEQLEDQGQKFIDPTDAISKNLQTILNPESDYQNLARISPNLRMAIKNYTAAPTFDYAHQLQSMLGSEAADFYSGANDIVDKNSAQFLTGTRNDLLDNIQNRLIENGDGDLSDKYNELSNFFKDNVQPYRDNTQLWNYIRGKTKSPNALNVVAGPFGANANDSETAKAISAHIALNPDQQNSFIAQQLTNNYRPSEGIVPEKIIANAKNMPSTMNNLLNDDTNTKINNLNALNNRYQNVRPSWSNFVKGGTLLGGLAALKHEFFPSHSEQLPYPGGYYGQNNL